jgi:hypothetical protein
MEELLWAWRAWHMRTETRYVPVDPTARGCKSRRAHTLTSHKRFDQVTAELRACIAAV